MPLTGTARPHAGGPTHGVPRSGPTYGYPTGPVTYDYGERTRSSDLWRPRQPGRPMEPPPAGPTHAVASTPPAEKGVK